MVRKDDADLCVKLMSADGLLEIQGGSGAEKEKDCGREPLETTLQSWGIIQNVGGVRCQESDEGKDCTGD
jgi:hypothetical protein